MVDKVIEVTQYCQIKAGEQPINFINNHKGKTNVKTQLVEVALASNQVGE